MRVARVKFNNGKNLYDYICDIKEVKEGDVVQVEDQIIPLFVYGIADIELKKGTTYKKVIKKLKENDKVTITTRYMNIVESDCDCIVNSLGINTNVFGAICKSIVNAAKSNDIEKMLKEYPTGKVFDYHVTNAGVLKPKKIIHIVMPFKKNDKDNKDLKKAFSLVIDEAISLGMKSIAIPCIGTGANGYSKKDIYDAIDDVMFKYIYTPDIEIEIQSIMYGTTEKQKRTQFNERIEAANRLLGSKPDGYEIHFNLKDIQKNVREINKLIMHFYYKEDELKIFKDDDEFYYWSAYSFIDYLIAESEETKSKMNVNLKKYYHRFNDISEFRTASKPLTRYDVFYIKICIFLFCVFVFQINHHRYCI